LEFLDDRLFELSSDHHDSCQNQNVFGRSLATIVTQEIGAKFFDVFVHKPSPFPSLIGLESPSL
jgi:hypothetical protein